MFPKPRPALTANTFEFESCPLVKPTGFREYDARWLFRARRSTSWACRRSAWASARCSHEMGVRPEIVTGHDFRGLFLVDQIRARLRPDGRRLQVNDIGLALTPMAYFAQFALDCPGVAMVTASHNENGWTGVKMGANRPLTFGPDEMGAARGHRARRRIQAAGGRRLRASSRISATAISPI